MEFEDRTTVGIVGPDAFREPGQIKLFSS